MNWYFVAAGSLAFAIGVVHSVLGERLIFRRMRSTGFIPTNGGQVLHEAHVRIIWASWHVVTALGWCAAVVLFLLALPSSRGSNQACVAGTIAAAMLLSSILVLWGTRGRHPGWAGLLGVAILIAAGLYA